EARGLENGGLPRTNDCVLAIRKSQYTGRISQVDTSIQNIEYRCPGRRRPRCVDDKLRSLPPGRRSLIENPDASRTSPMEKGKQASPQMKTGITLRSCGPQNFHFCQGTERDDALIRPAKHNAIVRSCAQMKAWAEDLVGLRKNPCVRAGRKHFD